MSRRNPLWPAGRRQAAQEADDADAEEAHDASPAVSSVDAGAPDSSSRADSPAGRPVANAGTCQAAADDDDPVAEMTTHFRSIQELFIADKQQTAMLAWHLRTAVDVQSLKARLQCAA